MEDEIEPDSARSRAVWKGDLPTVRTCLDYGENPDLPHNIEWTYSAASGRTPLMYALIRDDVPMTQLLLSYGAEVNAQAASGYSPVMYASVRTLPLLYEKDADLNSVNMRGHTALALAAWNSDFTKAEWLLNHGADVDMATVEKKTPLMYALIQNDLTMVELLISRGANVNALTHCGRSPVTYASMSAFPILHAHGANLNAVCTAVHGINQSILMFAVEEKNIGKVQWLLAHGADRNYTNDEGDDALSYAIDRDMLEVADLLMNDRQRPPSVNTRKAG